MSELYIGLMSGTSIDGIDAALVDFSGASPRLIDFLYRPFPQELRLRIHTLSLPDEPVLLIDYGALDCKLGLLFAETVLELLERTQIAANKIIAIGSHGQTVFHDPNPAYGFSLQIGDPNRIAQITGITTIADFRRRDMAVQGQGAPLVPAFHQAVFADQSQKRTVVNIGGIANITVLADIETIGFDTGPGNTFMDQWCLQHRNLAYDPNGDWAASGQVHDDLLAALKDDEYLRLPPPKSTGKEYFSPAWLQMKLSFFPGLSPEDVQATLCRFTAESIAEAIKHYAPHTTQTLVCGGGAHNRQLLKDLQENLNHPLMSTAEFGIHPDHVEACAFAWLARQTINNRPGNFCSVTGARQTVVLGGIYPSMQFFSGRE